MTPIVVFLFYLSAIDKVPVTATDQAKSTPFKSETLGSIVQEIQKVGSSILGSLSNLS